MEVAIALLIESAARELSKHLNGSFHFLVHYPLYNPNYPYVPPEPIAAGLRRSEGFRLPVDALRLGVSRVRRAYDD